MFNKIFKFYEKENNPLKIIPGFSKTFHLGISIISILMLLFILSFLFSISKQNIPCLILSIFILIILSLIFIYYKNKFKNLKKNYLNKYNRNVNNIYKFNDFEDLLDYNLLNYIDKTLGKDEKAFNSLYIQCDNKIYALENKNYLSPLTLIIIPAFISFFTSIILKFIDIFPNYLTTITIAIISILIFIFCVIISLKSLDSILFNSFKTKLSKYKNFKVAVKDAEILNYSLNKNKSVIAGKHKHPNNRNKRKNNK